MIDVADGSPTDDGRLSAKGVYSNVVLQYGRPLGLTDLPLFGPHAMRATAATNPLEHGADIAKVQRDALLAAGVDVRHLFEDHACGAKDDRAGVALALGFVRPGDVLVV